MMIDEAIEMELIEAVESSDLDRMKSLLLQHPEFVHHDYGMGTWLHFAAREKSVAMIEMLIGLGCDPNAEIDNSSRDTPLFCAIAKDDPATVEALLKHGADANKEHQGHVLTAVTGSKKNSLTMIKLLEQYGADLHRVFPFDGGRKVNALSMAMDWGKEDVAEYLRSKGCVLPEESQEVVTATSVDEDDVVDAEAVPESSDEVIAYFQEHFGPVDPVAQIEIVPSGPPISIHVIPPSKERNHITLFTTGMSDQPMDVPDTDEGRELQYAELFIQLPGDWKYRELGDPNYGWPFYWLRSMAQYPHVNNTWLGGAVTLVANGDPPQPLAPNTKFTTIMLMAERDFTSRAGHKVYLYRLVPLYTEERQLEIDEDLPTLMRALDRHSIPFIVDLNRPSVAAAD